MRARQVEVALAEVAASQWGLFTAPQAQHLGVSRVRLSRLAQAGVLVRLAHGVYALRGAMSSERLELRAAWLGLDPARLASDRLGDGPTGAVVSHASAADLFGLGDLDADRHEFTVPFRKQTRRPEVRLHRGTLEAAEVTLHDGLPVTTPERVVLDLLAAGYDGEHVAGVLASTVRDRRIDLSHLAVRLVPFAARFGLPPRDGQRLLDHLLDIGGVADLVAAEQLVNVARASNRTIGELFDFTVNTRMAEVAASIMQQQLPPMTINSATMQSEQLAAVMASLPKSQMAGAAALQRSYSTEVADTVAKVMRQARETKR